MDAFILDAFTLFKRGGNRAISVNPPDDYIGVHITTRGSDWLWSAMSLFGALTVLNFAVYLFLVRSALKRITFLIPFINNLIMAITYFTYASNLGYTGIATEWTGHTKADDGKWVRQIFYAKFVGWFLCWPGLLLLFEIDTTTFRPLRDFFENVVHFLLKFWGKLLCAWVWTIGLLIGALIRSTYKWGYFTFAVVGQLTCLALVAGSLFLLMGYSFEAGAKARWSLLLLLWALAWLTQTINWGLSEGSNRIQPDSEAVWAGVVDLINFGLIPTVLAFVLLFGSSESLLAKFKGPYDNYYQEKVVVDTPRALGDTAVAGESANADGEILAAEGADVNETTARQRAV